MADVVALPVRFAVGPQRIGTGVGLGAVIALVRRLLCVLVDVLAQGGGQHEALAAQVAHVGLLVLVHSLHMVGQPRPI